MLESFHSLVGYHHPGILSQSRIFALDNTQYPIIEFVIVSLEEFCALSPDAHLPVVSE